MKLVLISLGYLGLIISGSILGMTIGFVAGPIWLLTKYKFDKSSKSQKEENEKWNLEDLFK